MNEEKYGAFTIRVVDGAVFAIRQINGDFITIKLLPTEHVLYEGWYLQPPSRIEYALSGVCLWGREWFVEFEHTDKSNPPCRKSPALETERFKILEKLREEKRITKMGVPRNPSTYNRQLIAWEGYIAQMLKIREVFYHVPTPEYHHFIAEIECASSIAMAQAHAKLDTFSQEIHALVREAFGDITVHFIDPFSMASGNPTRSYLLPYRYPELLGIPVNGLIGIENMVEIRLAYEAIRAGGPIVPIVGCVIGIPNPYFEKGDGSNVIVLELEE